MRQKNATVFYGKKVGHSRHLPGNFLSKKKRALLLGALREFLGSGSGSSPPGIKQR